MSRRVAFAINAAHAGPSFKLALMLVVVAIKAKQFPIAAVHRVVMVIVVAVMDRQFAQVGARESPRATTTHPRIDFQGLFAIRLATFIGGTARISDNLIELAISFLTHDGILARPRFNASWC